MAGDTFLTFDPISIREVVPEPYDPHIYGYRYANGSGAERSAGFINIKRKLNQLFTQETRTADSLSRELQIELKALQQILDYLFTHAGEVAALELPGKETLYIWAGVEVAAEIRARLQISGLSIDTADLTSRDISAISAYITNLISLRPSIEIFDIAIEKCCKLLDDAKVLRSIKGGRELDQRATIFERKLADLKRRRNAELVRWSLSAKGAERPIEAHKASSTKPSGEIRYPFLTAYLLGNSYHYSGPEADKRFHANDPTLTLWDFSELRKLVIEIDSFVEEIESALKLLDIADQHIGSVFPAELTVLFRKIPGLIYPRKTERRMHQQVVGIRKRGYQVVDNIPV